nr:hypothetical transcript [Hymenolepis microstoma]
MDPTLQTPSTLVTKLKTQGFFDKTRKRCLEDLESNSDYFNLKNTVDEIVSSFLSDKFAKGSKIEFREKLRRRLQDDASLQCSISHMADLLLSTYASPDSLAPTINQITCEALQVDYQDWLNTCKKPPQPSSLPVIPDPTATAPPLPLTPGTTALAPSKSKVSEPVISPLLPSPILPTPPIKKEPLLPNTPSDLPITPLIAEFPFMQNQALPSSDIEMEVDDNGDDMEVESSDSNQNVTAKTEPIVKSRHADTPHKLPKPLLSHDFVDEGKPPSLLLNSSAFSRKISTVTRPQPASSLLHAGGSLDDISDNEMMGGDISPLRRRMTMSGNPVKQNSPPPSLNPVKQLNFGGGFERNPSPQHDTNQKTSTNSNSRFNRGHKDLRQLNRHHQDCTKDRDRDRNDGRDNHCRSRRDRDRNEDRHRETERHTERADRHNTNTLSRGSVGLLERQIRNPSPVIGSRLGSRDLSSRSQSPTVSTWRQRQSSPHFTKTPDSRVSNSQKHGISSDSKDSHTFKVPSKDFVWHRRNADRTKISHSRDRDKDRYRHDKQKSPPSKRHYDNSHHRYHHHQDKRDSEMRSRHRSRESSSSVRRSSPHQSTSASRHHENRRQVSPKVRLPSLSPPPRRGGNATSPIPPPKTSSRSNGFYL